jgi:hypothetical protein
VQGTARIDRLAVVDIESGPFRRHCAGPQLDNKSLLQKKQQFKNKNENEREKEGHSPPRIGYVC